MKNQFKPVDLVKLKVSGQTMTVKGLAIKPSPDGVITIEDRYECLWYNGTKKQKAVFYKDALDFRGVTRFVLLRFWMG
jgi:uncharacterized protein YodC (DUF2158 family)